MAVPERLVLVVDAHGLLALSLAIALRHAGFRRVATVEPDDLKLNGGVTPVEPVAGDIALLGLRHGDGSSALPLIRPLADTGCRVIVMASEQGMVLAGEYLHRGAEAVVDKAMSFEGLVVVLDRLAAGGCAMTGDERAGLLESIQRQSRAERVLHNPFEALTDREAEVFAALVEGTAPKQIARVNRISISTVRGHIQRVLSKLDVSSQREALAMARHAGWPY